MGFRGDFGLTRAPERHRLLNAMNPRIFLLAMSMFAFGSGAFIFAGLLEEVARDLGVSTGAAGQLQTAYVLVAALTGPPLAFALGRHDRKRILLIALSVAVVLNLGCMLVRGFYPLVAIRAMLGAMAALAGPAASSAAAALVPPERRGSAMAIVSGGMTVAFVIGLPMGSIVGDIFGWRYTFALSALLSLSALIAIALFLPPVPAPAPQAGGRLKLSATWAFYATTAVGFTGNFCISTFIAPIIRLQTGLTGAHIAPFQMLVGLGSFFGLALGARSADRGYGGWSVSASLAMLAIAAAVHWLELTGGAPPGWPTYIVVGLAFVTASTSLFSVMPVIQSRLIDAAPASAPLALAFNGSAASVGQASGAALGGLMLSLYSAQAIPVAAGCAALCAAALWWVAGRKAGLPQQVAAS